MESLIKKERRIESMEFKEGVTFQSFEEQDPKTLYKRLLQEQLAHSRTVQELEITRQRLVEVKETLASVQRLKSAEDIRHKSIKKQLEKEISELKDRNGKTTTLGVDDTLQNMKKCFREQMEIVEQENNQLKKKVADLQQASTQLSVHLEQERGNLRAEKIENRKLHDQFLDLQQRTFEMFRSNNSSNNERQVESLNYSLQRRNEELMKEFKLLQTENERVYNERQQFQLELEKTKKTLTQLKEEKSQLLTELFQESQRLIETKDQKEEDSVVPLPSSSKKPSPPLSELEAERETLKFLKEEQNKFRQEKTQFEEEKTRLRGENNAFREDNTKITFEKLNLQEEKLKLQEQLTNLREEKSRFETDRMKLTQTISNLQLQLDEQYENSETTRMNLEKERHRHAETRRQLEDARNFSTSSSQPRSYFNPISSTPLSSSSHSPYYLNHPSQYNPTSPFQSGKDRRSSPEPSFGSELPLPSSSFSMHPQSLPQNFDYLQRALATAENRNQDLLNQISHLHNTLNRLHESFLFSPNLETISKLKNHESTTPQNNNNQNLYKSEERKSNPTPIEIPVPPSPAPIPVTKKSVEVQTSMPLCDHAKTISQLETKLSTTQKWLDLLRSKMAKSPQPRKEGSSILEEKFVQEKQAKYEQQIGELKNQCSEQEEHIRQFREEAERFKQESLQLQNDLKLSQEKLKKIQSENDESNIRILGIMKDKNITPAQIEKFLSEIIRQIDLQQELQTKVTQFQSDLERKTRLVDSLRSELGETQALLKKISTKKEEQKSNFLRTEEALKKEKEEFKTQSLKQKVEIAGLHEELEGSRSILMIKEKEIETLKGIIEKFEKRPLVTSSASIANPNLGISPSPSLSNLSAFFNSNPSPTNSGPSPLANSIQEAKTDLEKEKQDFLNQMKQSFRIQVQLQNELRDTKRQLMIAQKEKMEFEEKNKELVKRETLLEQKLRFVEQPQTGTQYDLLSKLNKLREEAKFSVDSYQQGIISLSKRNLELEELLGKDSPHHTSHDQRANGVTSSPAPSLTEESVPTEVEVDMELELRENMERAAQKELEKEIAQREKSQKPLSFEDIEKMGESDDSITVSIPLINDYSSSPPVSSSPVPFQTEEPKLRPKFEGEDQDIPLEQTSNRKRTLKTNVSRSLSAKKDSNQNTDESPDEVHYRESFEELVLENEQLKKRVFELEIQIKQGSKQGDVDGEDQDSSSPVQSELDRNNWVQVIQLRQELTTMRVFVKRQEYQLKSKDHTIADLKEQLEMHQFTIQLKDKCIQEYQKILEEFHFFSHQNQVSDLVSSLDSTLEQLQDEEKAHLQTFQQLQVQLAKNVNSDSPTEEDYEYLYNLITQE